eukprot:5979629-Heterocapsa_arctica.AAC.1
MPNWILRSTGLNTATTRNGASWSQVGTNRKAEVSSSTPPSTGNAGGSRRMCSPSRRAARSRAA